MKNSKYILITIIVIFIVIVVYLKFALNNYTLISGETVYIGNPWKKVTNKDDEKLEKLIMTAHLYDCQRLLSKDTENGCYILACLDDENKWSYYYAIPNYDATLLSDEIVRELDDPK